MATLTPNYGLSQPDVGGDVDIWGGQWNTNAGIIDTEMKNNSDAVTALRDELRQLAVDLQNQQDKVGTVKWINNGDTVPPAWAECDGTNGTPDLRERVLVVVSDSQRGRQRGSKIWSQDSATAGTTAEPDHAHSMGSSVADDFVGNGGAVSLVKAHLPAEPLTVNGAGTYLTDRNTGNQSFDCSGSGTNVYRDTIGATENMGSGAGHAHGMTHGHTLSGQTTNSGGHSHNVSTPLGATYGMRAIQKIRLLVVGDLP